MYPDISKNLSNINYFFGYSFEQKRFRLYTIQHTNGNVHTNAIVAKISQKFLVTVTANVSGITAKCKMISQLSFI